MYRSFKTISVSSTTLQNIQYLRQAMYIINIKEYILSEVFMERKLKIICYGGNKN